MTNREWINSLSNEDFVTWLVGPIEWDSEKEEYKEPHPRLEFLKRTSTNFYKQRKNTRDFSRGMNCAGADNQDTN